MKPHYVTPRLAIAHLTCGADLAVLTQTIESRHRRYHHLFNLTPTRSQHVQQTCYKWRGHPFSPTQTLKIISHLDAFLRNNVANAAFLCTSTPLMRQFAYAVVKVYLSICAEPLSHPQTTAKMQTAIQSLNSWHPQFEAQMALLYKTIKVSEPPLRLIESLHIQPEGAFIPILDIYTEGRYNEYEHVYHHAIEQELTDYYLNLNRPLQTGVGKKYYDQKPQTKYLKTPVLVCGDVKIVIHSFKTIKLQQKCIIGFNTHSLVPQSDNLTLNQQDLYEADQQLPQNFTVHVGYAPYFDDDCREVTKKLQVRYGECQGELERVVRVRGEQEVRVMMGW